jgi:hypothetical protein
MSAHALEALAAAESAGVKITLDGDGLILELIRCLRTLSRCSGRSSPISCASLPAAKPPEPRLMLRRRRTACRSAGLLPRKAYGVSSAMDGATRRPY